MLTKQQLADAERYNSERIRRGELTSRDMPWPWASVSGAHFAWATALFQSLNGLAVDGKLGPATKRAIGRSADNTSVERPMPSSPSVPPETQGRSNAIVVDGARVLLPDEFMAAGFTASNYLDDGEPHFRHRERTEPLAHFVLHETCGNTAQGCKDTLLRKGYGVQLILAPSGHLSCHGDLVRDYMVHANQLNGSSFGCEVVNPYSPIYVTDPAIFIATIPAAWWTWVPSTKGKNGAAVQKILQRKGLAKVPREYVTPTRPQMAAMRVLAPWLCRITGVPFRFPTRDLGKRHPRIAGWDLKPAARPGPGVVAHRDFAGHSDGRYMLEDLIGRAQ